MYMGLTVSTRWVTISVHWDFENILFVIELNVNYSNYDPNNKYIIIRSCEFCVESLESHLSDGLTVIQITMAN